jgi:hypothetical protein
VRPLVGVLLIFSGCPAKTEPSADEADPLIQKLKLERERLAKGGKPGGPPSQTPAPITDLAEMTQKPPDVPIVVEVQNGSVSSGTVTITAKRFETAQVMSAAKVRLSTTDRFVRLVVSVSTLRDETFDLKRATLVRSGEQYELATDVQRVGQGSPLGSMVQGGIPQDLVLHFEVPQSALDTGLSLVLPSSAGTLTLPLL